jgi:hypothetical protein
LLPGRILVGKARSDQRYGSPLNADPSCLSATRMNEVGRMDPRLILFPAVAMFFLTFGVILRLGLARYSAIQKGAVSIKFFRTYDDGEQPARLHLLARHVQNHFEVPPLFYAGVLMAFVAGAVSPASVALAWSFVAIRCLHSFIHLRSNNVSVRFFTFGASLLALAGLWVWVFVALLERAD